MSRSEAISDPGVQVNDSVVFYIKRPLARGRVQRMRRTGVIVWVDRDRGTVEIVDRTGAEHTRQVTEVRRQQW